MLSVTNMPLKLIVILLNVIIPSVVMLSVVAPITQPCLKWIVLMGQTNHLRVAFVLQNHQSTYQRYKSQQLVNTSHSDRCIHIERLNMQCPGTRSFDLGLT